MVGKNSQDSHSVVILSFYQTVVILLVSVVLSQAMLSQTAYAETGDATSDAGLGVASFVATLPYGALKLAYAGLGAIVGGFTYVLTGADLDSAKIVWKKSILGTYVLTPDHLTGNKPIRFIGP